MTKSVIFALPHELFSAFFLAGIILYRQARKFDPAAAEIGRASLDNCQIVLNEARESWDPGNWAMRIFEFLLSSSGGTDDAQNRQLVYVPRREKGGRHPRSLLPYGDFCLSDNNNNKSPVVLLSAGVGLTPMVSILDTLISSSSSSSSLPSRKIHFIYGARAFSDHISSVEKQQPVMRGIVFTGSPAAHEKRGVDFYHLDWVDLQKPRRSADLFLDNAQTG
ncbi:hypothetical protein W97_00262 [Coniosporium apollinis CBS 100218]|uniref:Oxidoreductase FAD/NAD(P)-binding domain-containing protein n=1 Tax=Coniosporium apollinis (strain CBS 100218) TaxID=1168221 RepID=R7YHE1_CONA1|nr:uncharacterized protein W97_00262 [Coniosporium apollinis CBS 100218]EON61051.1 hypothetical protein W97_00262 [Coniosporium apollinis CBS 100218]